MVNVWNNLKDLLGIGALNKSNKADAENYNRLVAGEDIDNLTQQPAQQQAPKPTDTLLMSQNGEVDYPASVKLKQQVTPLSLADRLIGRTVSMDKEVIDPKTNEVSVQRYTDFRPGFFNDFSAGYKENRTTPISLNNFGQKKNFATRLGEGIGSLARIGESPAGRALMMAGIVGATGGSGLEALAYGGGAGMANQQNRLKDKLYRNALEQQGIDTTGINGYVGDDTFKNYSLANYRTRNLDIKQQLGLLKNDTDRAKLVNMMLNSGVLSPAEAVEQMGQYGINVSELDESNQTKLLPYKQYALRNGWDLGWAKFGLTQNTERIKNKILEDLIGGGTSNNKPEHKTNAF